MMFRLTDIAQHVTVGVSLELVAVQIIVLNVDVVVSKL